MMGNEGRISYDYQLTYLYRANRDVMGEMVGNKIKISLPGIIDNFARNLTDEVLVTLNVILLHELSHWADETHYGKDFRHSPGWNALLSGIAFSP